MNKLLQFSLHLTLCLQILYIGRTNFSILFCVCLHDIDMFSLEATPTFRTYSITQSLKQVRSKPRASLVSKQFVKMKEGAQNAFRTSVELFFLQRAPQKKRVMKQMARIPQSRELL